MPQLPGVLKRMLAVYKSSTLWVQSPAERVFVMQTPAVDGSPVNIPTYSWLAAVSVRALKGPVFLTRTPSSMYAAAMRDTAAAVVGHQAPASSRRMLE